MKENLNGCSEQVLIETSWNVKQAKVAIHVRRASVLIETSWNVKEGIAPIMERMLHVLIETSWNVKQIRQLEKTKLELCINRNIVECKELNVLIKSTMA